MYVVVHLYFFTLPDILSITMLHVYFVLHMETLFMYTYTLHCMSFVLVYHIDTVTV